MSHSQTSCHQFKRDMSVTELLESLAKSYLPPKAARAAKRLAVYPRYMAQMYACRRGFKQFGPLYPQQVLFVAGLPKSGTTWLEKMIASYPGFHDLLIPDVISFELATGGSHDYELPVDMFSHFKSMLVLTKMHVHGSPHNVTVLRSAGVKYVILYRDLRDVAVSHYYYVRQTPWHPEYPIYVTLSVTEGLNEFAKRTLSAYVDWVCSWSQNRDPDVSLMLSYEQMLADPYTAMTCVAQHFELDSSPGTIQKIVDKHSFNRLSSGRIQGQQDASSFFRKGIAGDWRNHFTPELNQIYKRVLGEFLIRFGYEEDITW